MPPAIDALPTRGVLSAQGAIRSEALSERLNALQRSLATQMSENCTILPLPPRATQHSQSAHTVASPSFVPDEGLWDAVDALGRGCASERRKTSITGGSSRAKDRLEKRMADWMVQGSSSRLLNELATCEKDRCIALLRRHVAERDHRRDFRRWRICERLHARTLARLRQSEEQLHQAELANSCDADKSCWAASSYLPLDHDQTVASSAPSPHSGAASIKLSALMMRLEQCERQLQDERSQHREEALSAETRLTVLQNARAEAQRYASALEEAIAARNLARNSERSQSHCRQHEVSVGDAIIQVEG